MGLACATLDLFLHKKQNSSSPNTHTPRLVCRSKAMETSRRRSRHVTAQNDCQGIRVIIHHGLCCHRRTSSLASLRFILGSRLSAAKRVSLHLSSSPRVCVSRVLRLLEKGSVRWCGGGHCRHDAFYNPCHWGASFTFWGWGRCQRNKNETTTMDRTFR